MRKRERSEIRSDPWSRSDTAKKKNNEQKKKKYMSLRSDELYMWCLGEYRRMIDGMMCTRGDIG